MSQRAEIERTKPCVYCDGTGACAATGGNCCDCHGECVVCILCWRPPSACDCPQGDVRTASNEIRRTRRPLGGASEGDDA